MNAEDRLVKELHALDILTFTNKRAAVHVKKLLQSAIANTYTNASQICNP